MRRLFLWAVVWTAVVVAMLLFWPSGVRSDGCWRLVDASAACLAQLADLNDRLWWTQTLPTMVFLSSGYVIVGAFAVRRLLRSRH